MVEVKKSITRQSVLKNLSIENGKIVDVDGNEKDLNKVVNSIFKEGDFFDFTVKSKEDDVETIEEDGDSDDE